MKKIIILLFVIGTYCNLFAQTTQEEYNYLTKGYKIQLESGLDMKKGYSLKDLGDWGLNHGSENRNCTFKGLVRDGQNKPCAILMIYKRTDISNGAVFHICIPINASGDIWQQTLDFVNANFKDNIQMSNAIIWALMHLSSQEVSK